MDHFYQAVPGFCDFADLYAAEVSRLADGAHVVEVGVWQGQSTAAMAVEILNSGKAIRLDVVDHFLGTPYEGEAGAVGYADLRQRFERHVAPVRHVIRQIHQAPSLDAADRYADESLDFVFIDADHAAVAVLADLQAWWPKIKRGGVLAGHDADWPSVDAAVQPWSECAGVSVQRIGRCWRVEKPARVESLETPAGERKCLVAVVSNERTIYRETVKSLTALGWGQRVTSAAQRHGFADVQFAWIDRHVRVDDNRNQAVVTAQGLGASHLLFLDADNTWPADLLTKMLAHHARGIVGGLYFLKAWPYSPVAFTSAAVNLAKRSVDYTYDLSAPGASMLRPAAMVGMGCTLIPMAAIDAIPAPWFEYRQDAHGFWSVTEDVAFCQKASAAGVPIWIDPTIVCGHVAQPIVTDDWFFRGQYERAKLLKAYGEAVPA